MEQVDLSREGHYAFLKFDRRESASKAILFLHHKLPPAEWCVPSFKCISPCPVHKQSDLNNILCVLRLGLLSDEEFKQATRDLGTFEGDVEVIEHIKRRKMQKDLAYGVDILEVAKRATYDDVNKPGL